MFVEPRFCLVGIVLFTVFFWPYYDRPALVRDRVIKVLVFVFK